MFKSKRIRWAVYIARMEEGRNDFAFVNEALSLRVS
jgi:hypothetical protein